MCWTDDTRKIPMGEHQMGSAGQITKMTAGRRTANPERKSSGRASTSKPRRSGAGGRGSPRSRSVMG